MMVAVAFAQERFRQKAERLAASLNLPWFPLASVRGEAACQGHGPLSHLLIYDDQGLALQPLGARAPGAVRVDFTALRRRAQAATPKREMVARALGVPGIPPFPRIIDATAGLGTDAFLLAHLGCQVVMLERQPLVAALLADGLKRLQQDATPSPSERMRLVVTDARHYLSTLNEDVDAILIDPMFPKRKAASRKEMHQLSVFSGHDEDAHETLALALSTARKRVAVKRSLHSPPLSGPPPHGTLAGNSTRFDLYNI